MWDWIAYRWLVITVIFTIIMFWKEKYFQKTNPSFNKDTATITRTKKKYIKTISEQKAYVRAKSNLGKDFITMVFSIFTFYMAFITLIYPRLPTLNIGLGVVVVFSIIFSFIYAKLVVTSTHITYHVVSAFLNYLYIGLFLIYKKFVYTGSPLLLLLVSIGLMIIINLLLEKFWVKYDSKNV
jgi:hypothetical protein